MWCVLGTPGMEKFRKITFSFGNCTHGPQRQYMPRIRGLLAVHSLGHIKHFSAGSDLCRIYLSSLAIYFSPFSIYKLSHRPCPSWSYKTNNLGLGKKSQSQKLSIPKEWSSCSFHDAKFSSKSERGDPPHCNCGERPGPRPRHRPDSLRAFPRLRCPRHLLPLQDHHHLHHQHPHDQDDSHVSLLGRLSTHVRYNANEYLMMVTKWCCWSNFSGGLILQIISILILAKVRILQITLMIIKFQICRPL